MAWDPVRATEQFLLPDFLAERRERTKTVSISGWVTPHIYWASSVYQNCIESLCVFFLLQVSEFFLNVKTLFNRLGHFEYAIAFVYTNK